VLIVSPKGVGPAIGAFLIRHPIIDLGSTALHAGEVKSVTSVFGVAAFCSFINLLLVLFVFPESLNSKILPTDLAVGSAASSDGDTSVPKAKKSAWGEFVEGFSHVATVFSPKWRDLPSGGRVRDWSLTLLVTALFGYLLATVTSSFFPSPCLADVVPVGNIPDQVFVCRPCVRVGL
jgi:hypothetical protein